jgi:hypothetical protein
MLGDSLIISPVSAPGSRICLSQLALLGRHAYAAAPLPSYPQPYYRLDPHPAGADAMGAADDAVGLVRPERQLWSVHARAPAALAVDAAATATAVALRAGDVLEIVHREFDAVLSLSLTSTLQCRIGKHSAASPV